MSTLWRKALADFGANKTRTFLMVLTITLGVFSVGFIGNLQATINRDMQADFDSSNPPEARIYGVEATDDWVRALASVPGVRDVEGRGQVSAQLVKADGSQVSIQFNVVKSLESMRVGTLKPADPLDGYIPVLGRRDVVIDRSAAGALTLKPGDLLEIQLPDGHMRQLRFQGYVHAVTGYPYSFTGFLTAYVTSETGEYLGGPKNFNQLLISVAQDQTNYDHVSSVAQAVVDRFKKDGFDNAQASISSNPGHHFAWQILQSGMLILGILGWLTVVLSGFLIVNTIVALMSQHVRQIGIMKAIGGGFWQIFAMYLALLLAFGGLALVISIPLSAWASYQVAAFMAGFLNYELGSFYIDPNIMLLQTVLALTVPLLAALAPLLNSVRVPVREALNNYGIGGSQGGKATDPLTGRLEFFPRPVLVSLRNAFRRKLRVSLTLFALVLGGAIFISVFNHWDALDRAMRDVQGYFLADINLSFMRPHHFEELESIAMKVPGVQKVEGWMSWGGQILSADGESWDQVSFLAPPANSTMIHPILTDGRWLTPLDKNTIVIGNHLLKIRPDLKVGDWVTIKLNDKKYDWQIIGIYRMPGNTSPPLLYTNYEYLSELMHVPHQVYELHVDIVQHDALTEDSVARQLQDAFGQRDMDIGDVQRGTEWIAEQKNQTNVLAYFLFFMAALIAFVGGLGLMGLMSINVMERTREIGVMRAIGAGNADIQLIVIAEGIVIGLVSWVLAIVLSLPVTYLLDYAIGISIFQAPLSVVYNWTGSVAWLAGILLISTLASAIPAWRASRLTIRETLVYE